MAQERARTRKQGPRRSITRGGVLAVVALVLGFVAIFGNPYHGHVVTLDTRELATIVDSEVDHVTPEELAAWIIRGATDFRLIDLRDEEEFATYHIPLAERVDIADLPDYPLLRNEKIVLCSGGGIHSAQAWFLLKAQGYPGAYILLGGLDAWKDDVLFPALADDTDPKTVARAREVSLFFGGALRGAAADTPEAPAMALPAVEAPAAPVVRPRTKKKKRGC